MGVTPFLLTARHTLTLRTLRLAPLPRQQIEAPKWLGGGGAAASVPLSSSAATAEVHPSFPAKQASAYGARWVVPLMPLMPLLLPLPNRQCRTLLRLRAVPTMRKRRRMRPSSRLAATPRATPRSVGGWMDAASFQRQALYKRIPGPLTSPWHAQRSHAHRASPGWRDRHHTPVQKQIAAWLSACCRAPLPVVFCNFCNSKRQRPPAGNSVHDQILC